MAPKMNASQKTSWWKAWVCMFFMTFGAPLLFLFYCYNRAMNQWQRPPGGLATLLIAAVCYAWTVKNIVVPFINSPLRNLPTPWTPGFIWGHGYPEMTSPPAKRLLEIALSVPNDGLIHWYGLGYIRSKIFPTSPQMLSEILNAKSYDFQKPPHGRRFLRRVLGDGLVVVEGKMHRVQRKGVTPAFQGKHIKSLVPLFWDKSRKMVEVISQKLSENSQEPREGVVEIGIESSRATLDIIGIAAMGKELNALNGSHDPLVTAYETILHPNQKKGAIYFLMHMLAPAWFIAILPWKFHRMIVQATKDLRVSCRQLVADKKASIKSESQDKKHVDILSVMLRDNNFDDDILVDQLLTFLAAGHETTSNALTWATMLLSQHQDVQARLREEILDKIPSLSSTAVDASVIDSMPYLHAVCNETLRFYPTVPATAREAVCDTQIGGVAIPKGTHLFLSPWVINRLPALWGPDAGVFNPERWLDQSATSAPSLPDDFIGVQADVEKGRADFAAGSNQNRANLGGATSPYALMTFIHGPRSCIGQGFARTELKCLLAALVMKFHIELAYPDREITPIGGVTMKPMEGMHLRLREL